MIFALMRHGDAEPINSYQQDKIRPLTPDGRINVSTKIKKWQSNFNHKPHKIILSPFIRTKQTAEICVKQFKQDIILEENKSLQPQFSYQSTIEELHIKPNENILIIAHNPQISLINQIIYYKANKSPNIQNIVDLKPADITLFKINIDSEEVFLNAMKDLKITFLGSL